MLAGIRTYWLANKAADQGLHVFSEVQFGEKSPSEDPAAVDNRAFPYCVVTAEPSQLIVVSDRSQLWRHEIIFVSHAGSFENARVAGNAVWDAFTPGFGALGDAGITLLAGELKKVRPITSLFLREDRRVYGWETRVEFESRHDR